MARSPLTGRARAARCGVLALAIVAMIGLVGGRSDAQRHRHRSKGKAAPAAPAPAPAAAPASAPDAAPDAPPDHGDGREKHGKDKPQVFDFTGIGIEGRLRTPQLLYFLDRASEELEQASLERRSFIPEMVRSLDEEGL